MRSGVPAPIPLLLGLTALWLALFRLQLAFSAQGAEAPPIRAAVWINGDPAGPIDWRGAVTLVEFWTFGCWNCANVEPHVKAWHEKYGPRGLRVIGVHSPELAAEREIDNVRRHVKKNGITGRSQSTTTSPSGSPSEPTRGPPGTWSIVPGASATPTSERERTTRPPRRSRSF